MVLTDVRLAAREAKQNKWDSRFLELAKVVASWSKDPSTKVGSVIVRSDRTVVSVGYNGFPKQLFDSQEEYGNKETKHPKIVHAEMNALIHCNEPLKGCTVYIYPFLSCDRCTSMLIQAGVVRFVAPQANEDQLTRWGQSFERTMQYIREAGLLVRIV